MAIDIKKTKIRLTRGKNSVISNTYTANPAGHPIYDLDKKYLYIGDGTTHIRNLKPITTNRLEDANYNIYGDSSNTYINSNKDIKVNLNSNTIFTVTANGLTFNGTKTITATTFKGSLDGNAKTASHATNVTIETDPTTSSDSVAFKIGTGTFATTINNVEKSKTSVGAMYPFTFVEDVSGTSVSLSLRSHEFINCTNTSGITSLTIAMSGVSDDLTEAGISTDLVMVENLVKFKAGSNLKVTLPNGISVANGFDLANDFEAGTTYFIYLLGAPANTAFISFV